MHISDTEETTRIPEITSEELQDAIRKLKKGKSPDSDGIRAEDIKACDEETKEMVRQIFNEWGARSSCDCDTNEQCPHKGRRLERAFSHAMGEMKDLLRNVLCGLVLILKKIWGCGRHREGACELLSLIHCDDSTSSPKWRTHS